MIHVAKCLGGSPALRGALQASCWRFWSLGLCRPSGCQVQAQSSWIAALAPPEGQAVVPVSMAPGQQVAQPPTGPFPLLGAQGHTGCAEKAEFEEFAPTEGGHCCSAFQRTVGHFITMATSTKASRS